jgi:hypothetical protein
VCFFRFIKFNFVTFLDKEASEEDYTKELKKKQEEALDIRRQIDELLLDSSREAAVKRTDLEKLLAENNEEITTMQTDRERELRKDNLQQQLEDYQKFIEDSKNLEDTSFEQYKADIEAKSSEAQLHLEAKNALMNGVMLDVSGNMVTLTSAFMDFQKRFGDGLGVLANQIQSDFINKLNEAKKVLDSMGNVTVTSNGTPIQGSFDNGGQVDFTGLAMVHGTSSNPEIMLNNSQASKLWNFIQNIPKFIAPKTTQLAGAGANVSMSFDSLINVNGNVDKAVMPSLQDLTNQVCDRLVRQLNMAGIYRR